MNDELDRQDDPAVQDAASAADDPQDDMLDPSALDVAKDDDAKADKPDALKIQLDEMRAELERMKSQKQEPPQDKPAAPVYDGSDNDPVAKELLPYSMKLKKQLEEGLLTEAEVVDQYMERYSEKLQSHKLKNEIETIRNEMRSLVGGSQVSILEKQLESVGIKPGTAVDREVRHRLRVDFNIDPAKPETLSGIDSNKLRTIVAYASSYSRDLVAKRSHRKQGGGAENRRDPVPRSDSAPVQGKGTNNAYPTVSDIIANAKIKAGY